jgi:hypothetical protein
VSRNRYLPRRFMNQGDRLGLSNGILVLSAFAAIALRLIPMIVALCKATRRHYDHVASQLTLRGYAPQPRVHNTVIVPVGGMQRGLVGVLSSPFRSPMEPLLEYKADRGGESKRWWQQLFARRRHWTNAILRHSVSQ